MDTKLQESIDKFRKLIGLAHSCYGSSKHKFNTRQEKTANQLFLKICLSLDSIDKILPQENHIPAQLNTSSLMILYRALMEENVIFEYLFDSSLEKEEKELRFDFYYCHGVVEEIKTLEELRTANPEDNDSRETPRKAKKEKLEKQKEDYKAELSIPPNIKHLNYLF